MHFFKFLSTSGKSWLDWLKIIVVLLLMVKASCGKIHFHQYEEGEISPSNKEGETPCAENKCKAWTTYQSY